MAKAKRAEDREERITMEIIVDAHASFSFFLEKAPLIMHANDFVIQER